jgi:hypothetical protein
MFISAAILASALAACDSGSVADVAEQSAAEVVSEVRGTPACDENLVLRAVAQQITESYPQFSGELVSTTELRYNELAESRFCEMRTHYNQYSDLRVLYRVAPEVPSGEIVVTTDSIDLVNTAEQNERFAAEAAQHRANAVQSTEAAVTP